MTLGEYLRRQRGIVGLTQREVSIAADIDQSRLSRLERDLGDKFLTPDELKRLAAALDSKPHDLMRAAGYPVNGDQDDPGTDSEDDSARIYTMLERNTSLTSYQKQIIRMALDDAARRRRELEGE